MESQRLRHLSTVNRFIFNTFTYGVHGGIEVKALHYKLAGHGFNS